MNLSDEELIEAQRSGARIIARNGGAVPPAAKKPPEPSDAMKIIAAINGLAEKMGSLDRSAPEVNVDAPQVTVKPQITVEAGKPAPRKWRVEVTERDKTSDQRIKTLTIEAVG